ncbi:hypothetical protein C8R42DRAFT_638745 [Lentinula raphanica]|nr:hypothetical protein C8R42DRAFT_638745 [Lentinula raphanica]
MQIERKRCLGCVWKEERSLDEVGTRCGERETANVVQIGPRLDGFAYLRVSPVHDDTITAGFDFNGVEDVRAGLRCCRRRPGGLGFGVKAKRCSVSKILIFPNVPAPPTGQELMATFLRRRLLWPRCLQTGRPAYFTQAGENFIHVVVEVDMKDFPADDEEGYNADKRRRRGWL